MISDPLNPLWQEMAKATGRLSFRQAEMLRGLGVPVAGLIAESMIGITAAEFDSRDFWTPVPTGKIMIVTPLEEDGRIADLIAFDPTDPDTWYLRTGTGWALGHDHLDEISRNAGWPDTQQWVDLHATPLDWLRAGCTGACVTQWNAESRSRLRHHDRIHVASSKFARALRLELTRPPRIPEIEVKGTQSRAA
ncbi:MAG: hypothetical protein H2050_07070 [Sphingobium sp.]|uniref:hypothetical protein n=1 Tax=Sphingobium sp. TaxID=1912891 RepID=UPI0017F61280|nr:hypothetical protein [Sphingobium sp.]MBA4754574.1 hypothetical protein [Sphingobium sp.]